MFTTFKNSSAHEIIYNNTIHNWAAFLPKIQPVLFSTFSNASIMEMAKSQGWHILSCPKVNEYNMPFLKDMYVEVTRLYNATLYGFVNGDIMFDQGLEETLVTIGDEMKFYKEILATGQRWNYHKKISSWNAISWRPSAIPQLAKHPAAHLYMDYAEDYFFVSRTFPWPRFKDIVIGRRAYDNYLVARSNQLNVLTVDMTGTVHALHQTGHAASVHGKKRGAKTNDSEYNINVIGPFNFLVGRTANAKYFTTHTEKGVIIKCRFCKKG